MISPFFVFAGIAAASPVTDLASAFVKRASASATCTNWNGTYNLTSITAPVQGNGSPASGASIVNLSIDDSSAGYKQTINGFGAAVTDATVITFNTLSSSTLSTLLNTLVTSSGANFGLMRHTIGASDLSPNNPSAYTYDDNGNGNGNYTGDVPDPNLTNFTLGSAGTAMANLLASMKSKNSGLQILGSPWSPPGWMKINGAVEGNASNNNLHDKYLRGDTVDYSSSFAQYFVKYIQAYNKAGANITAITVQNEPLNSQSGYPTMYMFDYEQGNLINNSIAPAFKSAGLSTSIWAYDHNTDVPSYPQHVMSQAPSVNTVAWHCYAPSLNWSAITTFKQQYPNSQHYMSECWTPSGTITTSNWFGPANFTMGPLQNWVSGVMAWTLGTNTNGPHMSGGCAYCSGLVQVNSDNTYSLNPAYYQMAQFSKFIPRGAIVLNGKGSSSNQNAPGVQFVSTLNPDKTKTVVILNTLSQDQYIHLTENSTKTVWSGNVPQLSLVTWTLPS